MQYLAICALRALLIDIADNGQTVKDMLSMVRLKAKLKRGIKLVALFPLHKRSNLSVAVIGLKSSSQGEPGE